MVRSLTNLAALRAKKKWAAWTLAWISPKLSAKSHTSDQVMYNERQMDYILKYLVQQNRTQSLNAITAALSGEALTEKARKVIKYRRGKLKLFK